ncbi:hypothetical protein [Burkholderia pseudomallei]|nr:hypothetical protein [Burkholderia pseudomallei]
MKVLFHKSSILIFVLLSDQAFSAQPYSCEVPDDIAGISFLMQDTEPASATNPNAGESYVMQYEPFGSYSYVSINGSGKVIHGKYEYIKKGKEKSEIISKETNDGVPTSYTIALTCENNNSGTYLYTQSSGPIKPAIRSNYAKYVIIPGPGRLEPIFPFKNSK